MADNIQALTIFEPRNVQTLASLAPQSYRDNQLSHTRCLEAGSALLQRVREEGMSDSLDMEIAKFLEKARATVKKMNGRRTPVTQFFDQIRKVYTSMENDVDPSKADSVPGQLQTFRNAYARKKHEEAERRRREQAAQKQEMDGLFGAPTAACASYQPKTQVKKKVVIETAEDIMRVVAFWWSQEGCAKTVEELCKEFKKQIAYANAAANSKDAPMFISDVRYADDVKAK